MKNNTEEPHRFKLLEHFVAPIVVGLVVLVGQFFIQPFIAQRQEILTAGWQAKRNCYIQAVNLVNQKFASMKWDGPDAANVEYKKSNPPTSEELNKCYTELILFSENKEIIRIYLACFGILPEMRPIKQEYRIKLLELMRKDLKFKAMHIEPDLVKFIVIP